jgi:hypothetical protein
MSISVLGLSFDTHDAAKLAQFWAQASIAADTDTRPGAVLMFHKVSEGKTVKNRVHLDLQATDVVAEADRLTSLGAQQISLTGREQQPLDQLPRPRRQRIRPRRKRMTLSGPAHTNRSPSITKE